MKTPGMAEKVFMPSPNSLTSKISPKPLSKNHEFVFEISDCY